MRVLFPCLFSSPVFALFFSVPLNSTFVLPFATLLCLSCFPNSPPSHWVTSSKCCHHPAQPFPSILFQPCHPDWCWFVPWVTWSHSSSGGSHAELSGAVWGEAITWWPFSKKHWIFHLPSPHSPTSSLSVTAKLGLHFSFPGSWSSIKKFCCYPLSTKIVPKNFEFKGCDIWKLPCGKDFICLNTLTSL